jgi:hypothetical protein
MHRSSLVLSVLLALNAASCAGGRAPSSAVAASPNDALQSQIVASGTKFRARLESPLSSERARVGDPVTARLDEPLVAGDGTVVAPRGARLTGRVLEVEREGLGRVALLFDQLQINGRAYPIVTTLLRMQSTRVVASTVEDSEAVATDVYSASSGAMPTGTGGGPQATPLESPPGAGLSFVLSRPFTLPAAASASELESIGEVDRTFR